MSEPPAREPWDWYQVSGMAMLAGLFGLGLLVNSRSWMDVVVAVGFGAIVLGAARVGQWMCQRMQEMPPPRPRWWVWEVLLFLLNLVFIGGLVWWWLGGTLGASGERGR